MLEIGVTQNGLKLNAAETKTHFAAWAIISSPLILSFDVRDRSLTKELWPLISNKDIIAVNQDWAGHSGRCVLFSRDDTQPVSYVCHIVRSGAPQT